MKHLLLTAMMVLMTSSAFAQVDKNFYIYICIGQSNMEGNAPYEQQDMEGVDPRFQVMAAVDYSGNQSNVHGRPSEVINKEKRTKGQWYTATPPLCRENTGLTPVDYFGRTMVQNLPKNVKVGVINVAIGGCKIEAFLKDSIPSYMTTGPDWLRNTAKNYDSDPYKYVIDLARQAQKVGVIKGILLHQGESNSGEESWTGKVKKVYNDMLTDLSLKAQDVPLFVGEVVSADRGGSCGPGMNPIIDKIGEAIPTAHPVSATGCTNAFDHLHFDAAGYRLIGMRYAQAALATMGIKYEVPAGLAKVESPLVSNGFGGSSCIFNYVNPNAKSVILSGDFGENKPMVKSADGVWTLSQGGLKAGKHTYTFIVDGKAILDPLNANKSEDGKQSVAEIPESRGFGGFGGFGGGFGGPRPQGQGGPRPQGAPQGPRQ